MSTVIRVVSLLLHRISVYIEKPEASCVPKDWIESFFKEVLQEKWAGKTWASRGKKKDKETENSNIISESRFHMIPCGNLRELNRRSYSASTYGSVYAQNCNRQGSLGRKCKLTDTAKDKRIPMSEGYHSRRRRRMDSWGKTYSEYKNQQSHLQWARMLSLP